MKKILIIILIVLTPTLAHAQWEQLGDKQIGENDGDTFGSRVSMSKDGLTIAASADFHNNASGQVVNTSSVKSSMGYIFQRIELPDMMNGVYYYVLSSNNSVYNGKLIVID